MEPYRTAIRFFISELIAIKISHQSTFESLRDKYKPTVDAMWVLRMGFAQAAAREVTTGMRFPRQIYRDAIQLLLDNVTRLGDEYSIKSKFYLVIVYGFLQALAVDCDAYIHRHGISNVIKKGEAPNFFPDLDGDYQVEKGVRVDPSHIVLDRYDESVLLNNPGKNYYAYGLGNSYFIDDFGNRRENGYTSPPWMNSHTSYPLSKRLKVLEKFHQQ